MRRQVLRMALLGLMLALFGVAGCKEIPGLISHNIVLNGAEHGKKLYKEAKDCTACHGVNLKGQAYVPGCYDCHGVIWNNDDHLVSIAGVKHKKGFFNAPDNCGDCHGGSSLKKENVHGKETFRPGCYDCHGDKWSLLETHTVNQGGYMHSSLGMYQPTTNCADCHGSDLKGGVTAPSCYTCHGARWLFSSYAHDVSKGGKKHGAALNSPVGTCDACHGSDLKGSTDAPSCYSCHGARWRMSEYPHTKEKDGYLHGTEYKNPVGVCEECHGTDLRGSDIAQSCYQCHGKEW
ncbi:MAG: hypothetical protein RRB13_06605 [bacterium]|nr:hypothetical protein [bacterium]